MPYTSRAPLSEDVDSDAIHNDRNISGAALKRDRRAPSKNWVETVFHKRECVKYIPCDKNNLRCYCGRELEEHKYLINNGSPSPGEIWYPSKCTIAFPSDAYGVLEFQGGPHPSKAQYIRVAHDTKPEYLMQLLLRVTKHVGDALLLERSQRTGRVNIIGITPWGIVENYQDLIGHNYEVPYHSISSPRSRNAALNSRHAYFLLVDNGTVGKYGAEIILRRRLEKYISKQRLYPFTQSPIPIVCLVIEGGPNTIRSVLEYVTDDPPVPVVICEGSGRASDLIAFMCKYDCYVLKTMKEYIVGTIQKAFEIAAELADGLFVELMQCVENKHLVKQLSLALTWNRADIARSEIFIYGQEWPLGSLEEAMIKALEHDRCDFVKLLLENGVSMRKFLTIPRLEHLYNSKQGPSNTLLYVLRDVRPHIPLGYWYTLHDIGLVINKLMGGAYRASYTRRKFKLIYSKIMYKGQSIANCSPKQTDTTSSNSGSENANPCLFDYPFNELLIWAVLLKRHKMALLMWQHGEEALAKALVACKLYKAMANEAAEDDLETEVYEELRNYGKQFENIALEVLDYCYRQDDDRTQQLLTCELQNWSGQTCLSLAVTANHRALLAHPCSQIILADLWMGGLRTRKNTNLKVVLSLAVMPYILTLEFKTREELQLMPQTTEEHMELENEDDDKSESEKFPDGEALLKGNFLPVDTIVHENGKVLPDLDEFNSRLVTDAYPEEISKQRELKIKKKLYEFYTAPITKFWANSLAYVTFLGMFSYMILVKMNPIPTWQEWVSVAFVFSLGCEKLRELFSSEPVGLTQKIVVWSWNMWNPCDMAAVFIFFIGLFLRLQEETIEVGRVIYCVNCIYWYLRILSILSVNKYLGPLVTMMGKMVKNMIYFVVLLLVVLMSFGVSRQAILFPDRAASWAIARDVLLEPYFMLYGEVYADKIDPPCGGGGPDEEECKTGRWIPPIIMSIYLLVANILLINLLIAVFNNIFNEVNAIAHQVWMFQRFTVVMEYEQKPILPPPFIMICHVYLLLKYLRRKLKGTEEGYDNGLKLFLDRDDMEKLYDFEEDCVEGYFAEQESKLQQSTEERIKITTERIEHLTQKIEDIHTKENMQTTVLQNLEVRCRKFTEQIQEISNELDDFRQLIRKRYYSEWDKGRFDEQIFADTDSKTSNVDKRKEPVTRSLSQIDTNIFARNEGVLDSSDETKAYQQLDNLLTHGRLHLDYLCQAAVSSDSKTSEESGSSDISAANIGDLSLEIIQHKDPKRNMNPSEEHIRSGKGKNVSRVRKSSEMSSPEIALNFEKENLRSAEECDYMAMEDLLQRRFIDEDNTHNEFFCYSVSETAEATNIESHERNTQMGLHTG
ncbi:hypothetical protein NQ317_008031 [Molorchus minor]|uniref:Transient receptor potential cation channel trpm n=1 Tax=Molorchus minor TaxID=1323400 RepID=A0ABQ9JQQ0_9CUCU|nr:hypothetical protein NQ317_008031 [Molorchus minor]